MRGAAFLLALLALTGCAGLPPGNAPSQPDVSAQAGAGASENRGAAAQPAEGANAQAHELLAYFSRVARLSAGEQKGELVQAAQAFGRDASPYARVKLGGLHALPLAGLRDDARAMALLEPLAKAPAQGIAPRDDALADIAYLLYAQAAERQRQQREDREERRRLQSNERGERQRLLREEARKQDALRERLEALKAIERSIIEREERSQAATQ